VEPQRQEVQAAEQLPLDTVVPGDEPGARRFEVAGAASVGWMEGEPSTWGEAQGSLRSAVVVAVVVAVVAVVAEARLVSAPWRGGSVRLVWGPEPGQSLWGRRRSRWIHGGRRGGILRCCCSRGDDACGENKGDCSPCQPAFLRAGHWATSIRSIHATVPSSRLHDPQYPLPQGFDAQAPTGFIVGRVGLAHKATV